MWARFLGQKDPLEKEMATNSSILAWKIPWTEVPGGLQSMWIRVGHWLKISSVQSLSRVRLCDPMNHRMPGLPVHRHLPEFTQTHVHWVSDAIQPSHPLSSPSPPAPNPSQHQSFPMSQLFAWGGQSTGVSALASVLPKKSKGWSPSEWNGWISLQSKGLSIVIFILWIPWAYIWWNY